MKRECKFEDTCRPFVLNSGLESLPLPGGQSWLRKTAVERPSMGNMYNEGVFLPLPLNRSKKHLLMLLQALKTRAQKN
jgi:hypothetical protein